MAHPVDEHLGARIRAIRRALGVSQDALAEQLGVTFQQVQKYERGQNRISASRLFDVAQALETPVCDFFEGLAFEGLAFEGLAFQGLAPDPSQTAPQSFAARVAAASGLRRLVAAYEALATEWERERLVQAVEVIVRLNDSGAVSP